MADARHPRRGPPSGAPPVSADLDTRSRLIVAMSRALQQRGYHGVGLSELLARADAPKGVLYHHFPGGKEALAVAAIDATADRIHQSLDRLIATGADPLPALDEWLRMARLQLEQSDYERGCPLATVSLETTADDEALRSALARAFDGIRSRLARLLASAGVDEARVHTLASLVVSAYEGALVQARVARSGDVMRDSAEALLSMIRSEIETGRRHRRPGGRQ